ncbi:MAG TPA: hypothetical protein VH599_01395 [Ktedonobacterales bacterium]
MPDAPQFFALPTSRRPPPFWRLKAAPGGQTPLVAPPSWRLDAGLLVRWSGRRTLTRAQRWPPSWRRYKWRSPGRGAGALAQRLAARMAALQVAFAWKGGGRAGEAVAAKPASGNGCLPRLCLGMLAPVGRSRTRVCTGSPRLDRRGVCTCSAAWKAATAARARTLPTGARRLDSPTVRRQGRRRYRRRSPSRPADQQASVGRQDGGATSGVRLEGQRARWRGGGRQDGGATSGV